MRKKEMLVTADTEPRALEKLREQMAEHVASKNIGPWRWLISPEAKEHRGQWHAYGRIEYKK